MRSADAMIASMAINSNILDTLNKATHNTVGLVDDALNGSSNNNNSSSSSPSINQKFAVGQSVIYLPFKEIKSDLAFIGAKNAIISGKVGKITKILSDLYLIAVPNEDGDEVVTSAAEGELDAVKPPMKISSGGIPVGKDFQRREVLDFLHNIPSLTKVPSSAVGIQKENYGPDGSVYLYTERLPDGHPVTIEFHFVPGDPGCTIYVVKTLTNELIWLNGNDTEDGGLYISDFEDWNLSEADRIDAALVKEMASNDKDDTDYVDKLIGKKGEKAPSHKIIKTPKIKKNFRTEPKTTFDDKGQGLFFGSSVDRHHWVVSKVTHRAF
jgi:hypothetical protein